MVLLLLTVLKYNFGPGQEAQNALAFMLQMQTAVFFYYQAKTFWITFTPFFFYIGS